MFQLYDYTNKRKKNYSMNKHNKLAHKQFAKEVMDWPECCDHSNTDYYVTLLLALWKHSTIKNRKDLAHQILADAVGWGINNA